MTTDNELVERLLRDFYVSDSYSPLVRNADTVKAAIWFTINALTTPEGERGAILARISELLACSVGGSVHFAVEPEHSSIEVRFRKRDEAGEMSRILTDLHPVDEEGCFVHNRPLPPPPGSVEG